MRYFVGLLGICFVGLIFWGLSAGDFFAEGSELWALAWGKVTLADLYLGFFLFSIFIFWIEKNKFLAVGLTILLMTLGNGVAAAYLVWRFDFFRKKLKQEKT